MCSMSLTTADLASIKSIIASVLDSALEPIRAEITAIHNDLNEIYDRLTTIEKTMGELAARLTRVEKHLGLYKPASKL